MVITNVRPSADESFGKAEKGEIIEIIHTKIVE
jgi:hypothetical protein